jgi:hypothetical protein
MTRPLGAPVISDDEQTSVDFSAELREQRMQYIKLRDRAAQIAAVCSNRDVDLAMAEQRMLLDSAIASIDDALNAYGR